jgi:hypothetical protein
VQHGVETYTLLDGPIGIFAEALQQIAFGVIVKSVHDFVGEAYEPINAANGRAETRVKQPDAHRERRGIPPSDEAAALEAGVVEELKMVHALLFIVARCQLSVYVWYGGFSQRISLANN